MPDDAIPAATRKKAANKGKKPAKPKAAKVRVAKAKTARGKTQGAEPPVRFVTAASLFDGHDVAINIMRRILQGAGAEVIHLGHNCSVDEVVNAAIEEDAQAIAVSSYQGGHIEYFKYMIDLLKELGRPEIKVFGGGGGVIAATEIAELHKYGVSRIFSPEDGRKIGLDGIIQEMIKGARAVYRGEKGKNRALQDQKSLNSLESGEKAVLARYITALELGKLPKKSLDAVRALAQKRDPAPVLGITGTGGAGKSSLTDELIRRFQLYSENPKIAVIAIDPSRRKTGGALLGDRIRMNAISAPNIYMRSLATRQATGEVPKALADILTCCQAADFDLIIVETPGIGQGDAAIVESADVSLYVMTPEFGAASQLEKIDMLDFADIVAINKMDRLGALDALRDVRKQVQRNRREFTKPPDDMPVYGTIASRFADPGVTALYQEVLAQFKSNGFKRLKSTARPVGIKASEPGTAIVPTERVRYLAEISETVRDYHATAGEQVAIARERQQLKASKHMLKKSGKKTADVDALIKAREEILDPRAAKLLQKWPAIKKSYAAGETPAPQKQETLSGTAIPQVALPPFEDDGELLRWLLRENLPGYFPYTAGVFPFKSEEEDPTRMFAGECDPFATNKRFKLLSRHSEAKRLSTAFDSVTLYGCDPHERPDIYGKVGNSGVSVATLDDMKVLYRGFDLSAPSTSVSMTINGPAPTILAMFLNTAISQQLDKFKA